MLASPQLLSSSAPQLLQDTYENRVDAKFDEYVASFGKVDLSTFLNENQKPRLKNARNWLLWSYIDINLLLELYPAWRDYVEFLVLHRLKSVGFEQKTIAVKCSKRGNDVYGWRTEKKLKFLKQSEDLVFFKPKDFDCEKIIKTRLLWVSLTWNSNLCSLKESWDSSQHYYNLFITNLRNRYGKIDVLRFPQAFPDKKGSAYGYHHEHLVLLFKDAEFTVFPSLNDRLELSYRINEKDELATQGKWHSFIDVKAINSMNGIYNYAVKHYQNAGFGTSEEATLNNAFCWLFKKKSYIVSGDFREKYADLIRTLHNSKRQMTQINLNYKVFSQEWIFIGIKSIVDMRNEYPNLIFDRDWSIELPFCAWDSSKDRSTC